MGKKGKNKNQTSTVHNTPTIPNKNIDEIKKVEESIPEIPKTETLVLEPTIVENVKEENPESNQGTLKSKKKRNRKKKNTATEIDIQEQNEELKIESTEEKPLVEPLLDTLKKKRSRNRKKNVPNSDDTREDDKLANAENGTEIITEKSADNAETSEKNTLKRKRNRNRNKNTVNKDQKEPLENEVASQKVEETGAQQEKSEPQRKGKKQKRFDLSSKKTILDELKEKQEREQKEARDHIKKEIAKREKLLETIDLVLDCHKSEVELAKNQQESLKDVKLLSQEAAKSRPQSSNSKTTKQIDQKSSPVETELVNKIEQVLGMTKLEIKNAQTQQAYVNRLEAEVAKVKQSKDILLGGQSSTAVPVHIQKMASEMKDLSKGEVPKTKQELLKEIESRDALMSEINRVLDTTKSEINKVQKQQKIIQNLEVELNKMKEQEIAEKLMILAEEQDEVPEPPPPPKHSAATASLLDALMANVGKLKEIQAMKEKQKAEQASVDENKVEPLPIADKREKSKSPQKDIKKITVDKKQQSPESSPKEQKKQPKDQKKPPQKLQEVQAEKIKEIKNENLAQIETLKDSCAVEIKTDVLPKSSEKAANVEIQKNQFNTDDTKKESIKTETTNSPKKEHKKMEQNKEKVNNAKEVKSSGNQKSNKTNSTPVNQENDKNLKSEVKTEEVTVPDQGKFESCEIKNENVKPDKSAEIKAIESNKPILQESEIKSKNNSNDERSDQKNNNNNKEQKSSPRSSHKNKSHKHEKKDILKGVPDVIPPVPITAQKPSMAEMLKNAPDPPLEDINKKLDDIKVEVAPLARPESAIIEIKPCEQIKEIVQQDLTEVNNVEIAKDLCANDAIETNNDDMVIINKSDVEAEMKDEKLNEQDLTDPKNVQRGGFVSPVDDKDAKPLKKEEKLQANKNKSPNKPPQKPSVQKSTQKSKGDVQAKVNSKPTESKKSPQSPIKTSSPTAEKTQPKFETANNTTVETSSSPKIDTQNISNDVTQSSITDKPKVPPRPDVTKTSNAKPATRAGNVTNPSGSPVKTKTPSPSKSPLISKPATTVSTAQSQSNAVKPKPTTVSQTRQSVTPKTPINTKSTNQKPLATTQKVNSTKTATPKPTSSMASATETK